jgi:hypothetical protein
MVPTQCSAGWPGTSQSSSSIEQDAADNWKPSKKKSIERIDGIVALVMGLDLASRQDDSVSIYSTPGNLAL